MLTQCKDCGKDVSTSATTCPHCGCPINQTTLKCPTCGSTDVEKISLAKKAGAIAGFGLFSMGYVSKTYKCKGCGVKF